MRNYLVNHYERIAFVDYLSEMNCIEKEFLNNEILKMSNELKHLFKRN